MSKEDIIEEMKLLEAIDIQLFMLTCAVDVEAMKAANMNRCRRGETPAYGEENFDAISQKINDRRDAIKKLYDKYRLQLLEEKGEIDDEFGAYEGRKINIMPINYPPCDCNTMEKCHLFNSIQPKGTINAIWSENDDDPPWRITADVPFESFNIYEDGKLWSVGAAFHISSEDKIWPL